jgi:predicted flap endonuclease-1-like 5' DNA nuclease
MGWLLGQTAVLLTIAFFVGAALGCLLRRMFAAPEVEMGFADGRSQVAAQASVSASRPPHPVEPLPEMARQPTPPSRFDRALTQGTVEAATAALANTTPVTPPVLQPRPAPVAPVVVQQLKPEPVAIPVVTRPTPAASIASTAVATAVAAVVRPVEATRTATESVARSANAAVDAAVAASGKTLATPQPRLADGGDDLQRIQGIDPDIVARLKGIGVTRFSEIAKWMQVDVARVGEVLGVRGRVQRENWVEQAQILASGGDTYFSRRRAQGQVATPMPTSTVVVADGARNRVLSAPLPPTVILPTTPATTAGQLGMEAAAAAAAALAAAARLVGTSTPTVPAPMPIIQTPVAEAGRVASLSMPRVEERAAFANQRPTSSSASQVSPTPVAATATTIDAVKSVRPLAQPMRDNLQRLSSVSAEIEKMLNGQGVSRYSHLASWVNSDVERFDKLLGSSGRIARENWIEQAQILSRGGDTAYSRDFDKRSIEASRENGDGKPEGKDSVLRPSRLADAIKSNAPSMPTPSVVPTISRPDISALRSVRSDAYRPSPVDAGTAAAAAAAAASGSARVVRSANVDDLKRIRGIGVLIERKLNSVGIVNYNQIGQWTNADIDKVSQVLDFKGRIERENWVEQARILSSGGQTEFSRRVDRGEVETSKAKD